MSSSPVDSPTSELGRWRTAIAGAEDERIILRGFDVAELIPALSFSEAMYLVLTGKRATKDQARMLDGLMIAVMDHGISPSSTVTRFVSASGVPIQAAVAAGIMTFGDIHGGAGEEMSKLLQQEVANARQSGTNFRDAAVTLVKDRRARKLPLPGFGHPQHASGDPRVPPLRALAEETGVAGDHLEFTAELETALSDELKRPMRLNIDGVMGSIVSDLGLDWRFARPLIFIPRAVGLAAHAVEELDREGGWRQIPLGAITYDGDPVGPLETIRTEAEQIEGD